MHSLRDIYATIVFESGHDSSSVAMRIGHRDVRSLNYYQNLRGGDGLRQKQDLLALARRIRINTRI